MDNKKIGIIIIVISLFLSGLLIFIKINLDRSYDMQIELYHNQGGNCVDESGECPHTMKAKAQVPIYIGFLIVAAFLILALYIMFLSKSDKEVVNLIKETKEKENIQNKFEVLLKGLEDDEKKVLRAIKEQDGISQTTLRYRTDLSKTKLSIVLAGFEKKGIISKVKKGKINNIFLKEAF